MSEYSSLTPVAEAGLLDQFWRWMCVPAREDPYSKALRELNVCYGQLLADAQTQDATLVRLYNTFHAHASGQHAPDTHRFTETVKWYKRNRDEAHIAVVKILETRALAHENPSKFMEVWEFMPEAIRQSRRKWRQPYTEGPAAERDVDDAFEMPRHRAPDVALDYETEFDASD